MTIRFITILVYRLSSEYIAKVTNNHKLEPTDIALVYDVDNDDYFISRAPPQVWSVEVICSKQDEFIQVVEQHKLLKLLDQ